MQGQNVARAKGGNKKPAIMETIMAETLTVCKGTGAHVKRLAMSVTYSSVLSAYVLSTLSRVHLSTYVCNNGVNANEIQT